MRFQLESDNPAPHVAQIHFSAPAGTYTVRGQRGVIAEVQLTGNGNEAVLDLPMNGGIKPNAFTITRRTSRNSQECVRQTAGTPSPPGTAPRI